jgi:hypothetical protein
MLDVQVEYLNKIDGTGFVHTPDVYEVDAAEFLEELLPDMTKKDREDIKSAHAALMRPLEGPDGSRYGRASLFMWDEKDVRGFPGSISVGGFVYLGHGLTVPYVGVIDGSTDEAARQAAYSAVPASVIGGWATEQAKLIDQTKFRKSQLLFASQRIIMAGGDPCALPYCFAGGSLVDYATAKQAIRTSSRVLVPLTVRYSSAKLYSYSDMTTPYFDHLMKKEVFILAKDEIDIFTEELIKLIEKEQKMEISISDLRLEVKRSLSVFMDALKGVWGCEPRITVREEQLLQVDLYSPPRLSWVLDLHRPT